MTHTRKEFQKVNKACYKLYEKSGYVAVIDFVIKEKSKCNPDYQNVQEERCDACENEMPSLEHTCLICGQSTHPTVPLYFEVVSHDYNYDLQREEIQIHAGQNGNIFLIKTDQGFVIDVYNQEENINTMAVWEDDLTPDTDELDLDDDGNCKYCGEKCFEGQMCDEQQAGGFDDCEDELCPICDTEVKLKNEFRVQQCPNCKLPILPCGICNHGTDAEHTKPCDCSTCPLEADIREQYIDKIMDENYGTDDPKNDESNRNYLRGMSTQTLIQMMEKFI